ncbi:MAG: PGF-pre-PGF domain-containing protein, partial [Methanosarcinales archaeon]|nr:PGF-pre-PGF domain-containing protein [Methanosarcinales archaeon]
DLGPSGWANITVWAWNATGDGNMSDTNVSYTVQAPAAILQRINITETSQTLNINESMTFNATGYDYTNAIYPSNITFTWYTTPSGIGTLNATTGSVVNFTALHAGRTEIYAVNSSVSSNETDSVWITVNAITNTTEVSGGNATATSGDSTAIVNLTNSTVTGTINFTEMGDPVNSSVVNGSTTGLGTNVKLIKGVDVNVSKNITQALANDTSGNSYVYIRIDYNQSQIDGLGIDEDTLHIYKFVNGTGWMELVQGNPTYCIANGRNTTADYIWVNVTNCSTFLLAGTPTAEPTPPRSSSGGGGGGGVGTSDEPENVEETVFLRIYLRAGDSSTYNFNNLVTSVEVTPTRTYGLLGAKMEVLYGQPGSITTDPPSGESYKYFNVFFARTSGSGDKFSSSVINFQVPESWFKENNIDPATVTLYRYNDDGWKPLTTTMTGQAGGNYQYSAPTPRFSTFVIMGQVNESSSVEPVATEDSGTVADSTPTEEATTKGTPGFGILVGIMGILVAVYSRKK